MSEINMKVYQITIVCFSNEFQFTSSICKNSFKDQIIPIKDAHQLANKDLCKKKDPDFIPDNDNDDLN